MNDKYTATRNDGVVEAYRVACPDELEIDVAGRTDLSRARIIGPDGRIDLGHYGQPRVEGRALAEIAGVIAQTTGAEPSKVSVRVAHFRSEQLFLFGQVIGWQRSIPYQGQETVLDVLQRVGGITPGAAPAEVLLVRSYLAEGKKPEVFHVDLAAIVLKKDMRTNLRVLPQDQIFVGETRQARVERCIPPWIRPIYQSLWNTRPSFKPETDAPGSPWVSGADSPAK
ncbi:MAG: polysaccharide biosynthesis/export family protein [Planctomycetes bacterium]|nr:polysaccharide biosynthesis/export family protein [Planctomycetota bacterium]